MSQSELAWIAVDWGSSFVRLWAMSANQQVLANKQNDQGAAKLTADQFEAVLLSLIADWLPSNVSTAIPVLICGMAGSRQGWQEAPYLSVPITLHADLQFTRPVVHDPRIQVFILPGLKQAAPPDVLRGEETQLLGFLKSNPEFNGVVSLPGTHNKWVRLEQQRVLQFSTCMTGELYQLLSEQSLLRHSLQGEGWSNEAFDQAVLNAYQQPQAFAQRLFSIRASQLVQGTTSAELKARLSGELLGLEISAMQSAGFIHDLPIVLIGKRSLSELYARALKLLGYQAEITDGESLTLQGLISAFEEFMVCKTLVN